MKIRFSSLCALGCACFLIAFTLAANAQGGITQKLANIKAEANFTSVDLLQVANKSAIPEKYKTQVSNSIFDQLIFFDIDVEALTAVKNNAPDLISFNVNLPIEGQVELELYRQNVLSENFNAQDNYGNDLTDQVTSVRFYRGKIAGETKSLVSVTIFDDQISGVISLEDKNYNLGVLQGTKQHVLFSEKSLMIPEGFECGTEDEISDIAKEWNPVAAANKVTQNCVNVKIEVDSDLRLALGGTDQATEYALGLMNEVVTLYANDDINISLSELYIYVDSSPYEGADNVLDAIEHNSSISDLTALITKRVGTSGLAYVGGLCNDNYAKSYNGVRGNYSSLPTYTWDVNVLAHELGHNLGSQHTHSCAWNGNNTAIDGCGPSSCDADIPDAGTIMSYCHQIPNVGVDFNLGFGPQPKERITDFINVSSCLNSNCLGLVASCNDGLQNGTETGVDCGGSCGPCPTCNDGEMNGLEWGVDCGGDCGDCNCNGSEVFLEVNFDVFPAETSWAISNEQGENFYFGNGQGQTNGSTVSIPLPLDCGCYTLTMMDSYGDGLCCSAGTGSFAIKDGDGNVIAQGNPDFEDSTTLNFCTESSPTSGVSVNLRTMLQGPFNSQNNMMNDYLRQQGKVPLNEPYSEMGYNVPSVNTTSSILAINGVNAVVDWVLVELRHPGNPSIILASQSGLLLRNGKIVTATGGQVMNFNNVSASNVHIAVRHRNHIGIRTGQPQSTSSTINFNFYSLNSNINGNTPTHIASNRRMMYSGDANGDGYVNAIDLNLFWRPNNSQNVNYENAQADFDLNGAVNAFDKNFHWRLNVPKAQNLD